MEELVIYGSQAVSSTDTNASGTLIVCELFSGDLVSSIPLSKPLSHGQSFDASSKRHVFAIQHDHPSLTVYSIGNKAENVVFSLPEQLMSIKVSSSGTWLAGGSLESGRVYLWELASGNLMTVLEKQTMGITSIEFSADESFMFTGSARGSIFGWRVLDLITSAPDTIVQPAFEWDTTHALGITGLCVGYGQGIDNRVYSSSADTTLRTWNMVNDQLACSYILPDKVSALALDPAERAIYCGLENGDIVTVDRFKINPATGLVGPSQDSEDHIKVDGSNVRLVRPDADSKKYSVTSLAVSFDGSIIVAGYSDGQVYSYDTATNQMLSQLVAQKGPISGVQIVQGINGPSSHLSIPKELGSKMLSEQDHGVWVKIQDQGEDQDTKCDVERSRLQAGTFSADSTDTSLQAKVHQLEQEVARVQKCYNELSNVHQELWKLHSQKD